MRRHALAVALALGLGACSETARAPLPEVSPTPRPEVSPAVPEPTPLPLPLPLLPFVKRLQGVDRLFLYNAVAQEVVEIPEAATGGPILNPFYFERRGEGRVLYNSGGGRVECPAGSGVTVPAVTSFGAYVFDLARRLSFRHSEDDFFHSVTSADGRIFAHLDATSFPEPQEIQLILTGPEPFDVEAVVASIGLEPGILVDLSMAALGRWIAAVKGERFAPSCLFPPPVDGQLYLYDLEEFILTSLTGPFGLPPLRSAALSPSGRQVIMLAGEQLLRLDRMAGTLDRMPVLNEHRAGGAFREVRFIASIEEVFYLEYRPPGGRSRILAYDWQAQRLNLLPMVNLVGEQADLHLSPPY